MEDNIMLCPSCCYNVHGRCFKEMRMRSVFGLSECSQYIKYQNSDSTINHPKHYNHGKFEAIAVIEDWSLGFNLGNTVTYIAGADHKGDKIQDLEKARWYLEREINNLKALKLEVKEEI